MTLDEHARKILPVLRRLLESPDWEFRAEEAVNVITAELRSAVEEAVADRLKKEWPECESADKWIRMGKSDYADIGYEIQKRIRARAEELK